MFVIVHTCDPCSWLEIQSSCIKAHSFSYPTNILLACWISVPLQADEDRLILTRSSDGMHQSKALIKQLITSDCGYFKSGVLLCNLLGFGQHKSSRSFICSGISPLCGLNLAFCELNDIVILWLFLKRNGHFLFWLLLPREFVSFDQYL